MLNEVELYGVEMGKENEEEEKTTENLEQENDELVFQLDWCHKSKE